MSIDNPSHEWALPYEQLEAPALPAGTELVRNAQIFERDGWPYPVSGDSTTTAGLLRQRGRRPKLTAVARGQHEPLLNQLAKTTLRRGRL